MKRISLDETSACQAHASLYDGSTALARVIADSQVALATQAVSWHVTVTPRNVHCVESLMLLAQHTGCSAVFEPGAQLNTRERAFLDDILEHYAQAADVPQGKRGGPGIQVCAGVAREALKILLRMLPASLRRRRDVNGHEFRHATLAGIHGGEHIGDIASVGGVLLRLQRQFGLQEACLFSLRPGYTRHLAAQLEIPVTLEVQSGEPALLKRELKTTGALVWAGGPLMDQPPALLQRLAAIYAVRRRGRPVLLEGIGMDPLRHAASRWAARRIALAADRICVRTSGAQKDPVLEQIDVRIEQDPAFDYLATRAELTRLHERDRESVDALLQNTGGHIIVGINLRPIRHVRGEPLESYSRAMESRLFQHLAVAITDYARLAPAPVTYVFFPMSLIQAGCSDLAAAWRLNRLLHKGLDLRVWEADPDIDAVLYLLRRLDMALTMRFHACIFSMSQGVPTIGIDYNLDVAGKVGQLFRDRERVEDYRRLDEVDIHFMVERLLKNQPGGNNHPEKYP